MSSPLSWLSRTENKTHAEMEDENGNRKGSVLHCYVIVLFRTHTLYTSDIWSSPFVQCLTDIAWWTRTSRPELLLSWTWPCGNYLFWLWAVVYTHSFLERRQKGLEGMWFPPNCYRSNHTLIIHITVIQFLCVTRACSCTVALHYCLT